MVKRPHRQVSQEEALSLAKKYSLNYMETSAKSGDGVNRAFQMLLIDIHKIHGSVPYNTSDRGESVLNSGSQTIILTSPDKPQEIEKKKKECCF
jgi:hypothetical protein